jgi:NADPH-dependent curcumin reductase CurA
MSDAPSYAPPGPNRAAALMSAILRKSLTVRGFIQNEFADTLTMLDGTNFGKLIIAVS